MTQLNRRELLAAGAVGALAAGGAGVGASLAAARNAVPQPVRGDDGAPIIGPRNVAVERENPDQISPPATDAGSVPNLKFPFDAGHTRITTGGWAREVTVRELPVATQIAGVNMRLKPGAIRELHWHKAAEWAFLLAGRVRITAVNVEGANFVDDVSSGDIWFFPAGIPHSIQALDDEVEFLLVFDDGNFNENETFLLTDWFAHTPLHVLAKSFGVPESALAKAVAPAIEADGVGPPEGTVRRPYSYPLLQQIPLKATGGRVRIVDSSTFPVATSIAGALVEIEPGGMRELHWHPNLADEWQYYISGQARMTVFATDGTAGTFDYQAGDVGYVPFPMGHSIENRGDETVRFLEIFRSDRFADISLSQWIALTPPELIQQHLNLDRRTIKALPKRKPLVVR
ncbi:MAG TPA: cupin domain-containing protein [Actinomycetota bacterium]|nr:cupin domain-containing protein [Actinomycetota bacterium]